MIILLTGKPGVGKSTVIQKLIDINKEPANWVVTSAILRPERGDRGGFAATNSAGVTRTISHKTDIDSNVVIGENHVDVAAVDAMFADALAPRHKLIIIDEIGPIQLLSPAFTAALADVFASSVDMIATIHYNDQRLAEYRDSPRALLINVTQQNRDILPKALAAVAQRRHDVHTLTQAQQTEFYRLLGGYCTNAKLLQIQKLATHGLDYVVQNHVTPTTPTSWHITGNRGDYTVTSTPNDLHCTCNLFNGLAEYTGKAGDCSHIQAVRIFNVY